MSDINFGLNDQISTSRFVYSAKFKKKSSIILFRAPQNPSTEASLEGSNIDWEKKLDEISQNLEEVVQNSRIRKRASTPKILTTESSSQRKDDDWQKHRQNGAVNVARNEARSQSENAAQSRSRSRPESHSRSHLRIAIEKLQADEELNGNSTVEVRTRALAKIWCFRWWISCMFNAGCNLFLLYAKPSMCGEYTFFLNRIIMV